MLVATLLQQLGGLPTDPRFFLALFPAGFGKIMPDADGKVDLINQDFGSVSAAWLIPAIAWEAFLVSKVLPSNQRPKHTYRWNDTISSLSTSTLYLLFGHVWFLACADLLYGFIYKQLAVTRAFQGNRSPLTWWLAVVAGDMCYYLGHRASHYFSWMWLEHNVHHSSEEFNLSTALRAHFVASEALLFPMPIAFVFPPELVVFQAQFGLMYQFWLHTQLVPPLPKLELLFNTPSLHRIHHARNLRALGKNYGGIFSLWDRIGRTFEPEEADSEPLCYGIIPPLNSWNPFWANFHHLHHMIFVQSKWHGWKTPFVHWTPPNGHCPRLGSRLNPYEKFNASPSTPALQAYVIVQFSLVFLGVALFLPLVPLPRDWSQTLSVGFVGACFLAVLFSLVCISSLESAGSVRSLHIWLLADGCRHMVIIAAVVAASVLPVLESRVMMIYFGVGIYAAIHIGCLVPLFMSPKPHVM